MDELKILLAQLKEALEMYNNLNPEERVQIVPQKKDVRDSFICVYNDIHVGLFKKINWSSKICHGRYGDEYDAGSIYEGIDSDYIGMKQTHDEIISVNRWQPVGKKIVLDGEPYVSNCVMQDGMSFDDMRLIMYNEGQIGLYERGMASDEEILEVLKYALSYYQTKRASKGKK